MAITHAKVSGKTDSSDASLVLPSDWNAAHVGTADPKAHKASHGVGGADSVFPADPGSDQYLKWDDSESVFVFDSPSGGGDVTGPASSTDNEIARHHSTTGKVLQTYTSNPPTISDTGDMNIDGDLDVENIVVSGLVDGVDIATRDHAKYTNDEAVAAVAAAGFVLADAKYITFTDPSVSHTYSGFVKSCLAHENLVFGDVCFINGDEELVKANGAAIATMPAVCMAVATINADASGLCLFWGFVHDDTFAFAHTGGIANNVVISESTAGLATTTVPTGSSAVVQVLGHALATDEMFFNPNLEVIELVA